MPSPRPLDYQELARLLDLAASEHRQLGAASTDPVASYQLRKSVDFFTAARFPASSQKLKGLQREPGCWLDALSWEDPWVGG